MRLVFIAALFYVQAQASIQIIHQSDSHFAPAAATCAAHDICDLKDFRFVEQKKKVILPKSPEKFAYLMTDTRAVYQTASTEQIEKYAVVQQIQGCVFESDWDGKTETRYLNIVRNHMGNQVIFQHKHWQIDNDFPGPVYTTLQMEDGNASLFYLLNWNTDPKSLDANNSKFYGRQLPSHPVVFATDLPAPASLRETLPGNPLSAQNSSLEFRTCLFKTADLPKGTDADGSNIAFTKAIHCFSWDHKFVYDFKTRGFKSPAAIEPVCLK